MRENILNDLNLITPSRIDGRRRWDYATASVRSLREAVGDGLVHIVVHDMPAYLNRMPSGLRGMLPYARWHFKASEVYNQGKAHVKVRCGSGSASAALEAAREASEKGAKYCFIHLDDHVYLPLFGKLLEHGYDALEADPELMWVRFSGYPLIYAKRTPLQEKDDEVKFDGVKLRPWRTPEYTLWWDYLGKNTVRGRYWPVAMWFCVFRLTFLESLLEQAPTEPGRHLADVEVFYKLESNWEKLVSNSGGKFGYVNMQYGGIEMHRNKNWRELMRTPNDEIR